MTSKPAFNNEKNGSINIYDKLIKLIEASKINIDSVKLKIPLHDVEIKEGNLKGNWHTCNEYTGEVRKTQLPSEIINVDNQYSIPIQITKQRFSKDGPPILALSIGGSAKILESNYLDGINENNLSIFYDKIMSLRVFYVNQEVFMKALCTDIDLSHDFKNPFNDIDELFKVIANSAKLSKLRNKGYNKFRASQNKGIEFAKRTTSSYINAPFLKYYAKDLELSPEFKAAYLKSIKIPEIRGEVNIKNRKHLKNYNILDSSIKNIVRIPQDVRRYIFKRAIHSHIDDNVEYKQGNMRFDIRDTFIKYLAREGKTLFDENNMDSSIDQFAISYGISRDSKCKLKKRLNALFSI